MLEFNVPGTETPVVDAIASSNRKFNSIYLGSSGEDRKPMESHPMREVIVIRSRLTEKTIANLFRVLPTIGEDIKSLTFERLGLDADLDLKSLLKQLPNLEKLVFDTFCSDRCPESSDERLLLKLKELTVINCNASELRRFDHLPSTTVLRTLKLLCLNQSVHWNSNITRHKSQFYLKQTNIKELSICSHYEDFYDLRQLKSLSKLRAKIHSSESLAFICRDLLPLVTLELYLAEGVECPSLAKLPNLRTFKIFCENPCATLDGYLNRISSPTVTTLSVGCKIPFDLPNPTLRSLADRFPKMENLELSCAVDNHIVRKIIEIFLTIKTLTVFEIRNSRQCEASNVTNESLTKIREVNCVSRCNPTTFGSCLNLKSLCLSSQIDNSCLKDLLIFVPSLTKLNFPNRNNEITSDFVETLKTYGRNIREFICQGFDIECIIKPQITQEMVVRELGHQFKNIKVIVRCDYGRIGDKLGFNLYQWEMNNFESGLTQVFEESKLRLANMGWNGEHEFAVAGRSSE